MSWNCSHSFCLEVSLFHCFLVVSFAFFIFILSLYFFLLYFLYFFLSFFLSFITKTLLAEICREKGETLFPSRNFFFTFLYFSFLFFSTQQNILPQYVVVLIHKLFHLKNILYKQPFKNWFTFIPNLST